MRIRKKSAIWNLHSHSKFSVGDALPSVAEMVATVAGYGQPALGLTDHGNMGGSVQLYKHCMKAGIVPFPGSELYVVHDRNDKKAKRHHMCVVAYTSQGYDNLVRLSSASHRNFYHKPLLDHADLAEMSEAGMLRGIAATSGCYFGFIAQAIASGDERQAVSLLRTYDKWFDRFYVELQNHGIDHGNGMDDDALAASLHRLALESGIPAVITQDSHYCHQEDKEIHDALKQLVGFGPEADDAVFPGDGFGLADERWLVERHDPARFAYGCEGLADLLRANALAIPELDAYHYRIPFTVAGPDDVLQRLAAGALEGRDLPARYADRLAEELEIIRDTGMAGYLLLVKDVTDWCRENQVFYQARGSASGSMACWLLGITQADPLKWSLSFERFISRDRTKPPDIDLDIEHDRRKDLVEWLRGRFTVVQIGTWSEYSMKGEEGDEGDDAKGSILVKYYSGNRRRGAGATRWEDVPAKDRELLHKVAERKPFASYGTHAAGLVVTTTDGELSRLVPTMHIASSGTVVTQYEMDDIESLGLVKLDVLGLKTLSVLNRCMQNLGRDVFGGLDWIPLSDSRTYARISQGRTEGVFQLEGFSAQYGCMELKPTKIGDVIAAMALFRPATQNSGATRSYVNRRKGTERIPARHEVIARHTSKTYGIMLFQEQVISILRELGMSPDDLTAFLKAVKASNSSIGDAGKVIEGYQHRVREMAEASGFSDDDWQWLWHAIEGFAAYGFNQAHSTAYGLTAYRCAYLATHHPVEFFAALLAVAAGTSKPKKDKESKEDKYLRAARAEKIRIRPPDVNRSQVSYAIDRGSIRKGLRSVKGIGEPTAASIVSRRPEGGWASVADFARSMAGTKVTGVGPYLERGDLEVGIVGKLHAAGALDSLLEGP